MFRFVISRVGRGIPVLLIASVALFALIRAIPGDPALALGGPDASPETIAALRETLALDAPLWQQYLTWMGQLVQFDLGTSLISKQPVIELVGYRFSATLALVLAALFIAIVVGVGLGVLAGLRRGTVLDNILSALTATMMGIAPFWLGYLLILLFAVTLGWLPSGGYVPFAEDPGRALQTLALPALCLGITQAGVLARFTRASVVEVREELYVTTAASKGVDPSRVVFSHILRNALIPILTIFAIQIGNLLGGAVVIESMFSWPGVGRQLLEAVSARDYPVIQAILMLSLVVFVVLNILTDLLYGVFDPRLRSEVKA
ncbi:MAG: hypothetical protein CMF56_10460 [Leifsonia sp.]|nr:hypothetical protein [Leifsonia sp.]|tara:strand:+ start:147796 stop:148749 length:954 start_codon:yes stop_codon:yes gene_type:complete